MGGNMLQVFINRLWKKEEYTIGRIYVNGEMFCNSLEDKDRGLQQGMPIGTLKKMKVQDETAIPTGTYRLRVTYSPKFKRKLIEVVDVPAFTGIRFHRGANASHSSGCVLTGMNTIKGGLTDGAKYEEELTKKVEAANEAFLTVI